MNFGMRSLDSASRIIQQVAPHQIYDHDKVQRRQRTITESQDDVDGLDAEFGALFGALGDIMNESADPTTETPAPRPAVEQKQFVTAAIAAKNNAAKHTKEVPSQPKPGMFPTADSDNAKLAAKGDLFKKTLTDNFVDEDNATLIEAVIKVFDLVVLGI